jgi:hypothetical protein
MKNAILGMTLVALIVTLVACNKKATSTTTTNATSSLSPEAELVLGTLKLEGTDLAVTADQAKQLLPLWQTLQTMSSDSTAATEELNALIDQIKSTMTTQQIDEIAAMKLTQQDLMTVMANAGVGFGGASGTPNATQQANQQFFQGPPDTSGGGSSPSFGTGGGGSSSGGPSSSGPSGAMPGGGQMPSGGFVTQGDQGGPGTMPGQSTTPQAVRGNGFSSQIPSPLLNAFIQMLQKKTQ